MVGRPTLALSLTPCSPSDSPQSEGSISRSDREPSDNRDKTTTPIFAFIGNVRSGPKSRDLSARTQGPNPSLTSFLPSLVLLITGGRPGLLLVDKLYFIGRGDSSEVLLCLSEAWDVFC